jgi:transcriptional regulator with XRE-family HTH domain
MSDIGSINDRFKKVKDYSGLSVNRFAKMIGVSQPTAKAIIDGDNEPSNKAIEGLAKGFPMISMDWLIKGFGRMFCPTETKDINEMFDDKPQKEQSLTDTDKDKDKIIVSQQETIASQQETIRLLQNIIQNGMQSNK